MKKLFSALMLFACLLAIAPPARAQSAPYQDKATIAAAGLTATWAAPAATYGPLLSLETVNTAAGATLKVEHIIPVTSVLNITNTVESTGAGGTLLCYPSATIYTNSVVVSKPTWICPGDKLLFTVSATNMAPSYIVIRAGHPGK